MKRRNNLPAKVRKTFEENKHFFLHELMVSIGNNNIFKICFRSIFLYCLKETSWKILAKRDSVWNRTFSAGYLNGKNQNSNIFKSEVALYLSGKPQQSLSPSLSLSPFFEGTLRCLSRPKIFPPCLFLFRQKLFSLMFSCFFREQH